MEDDAKRWDEAVSVRIYESIELLMNGERRGAMNRVWFDMPKFECEKSAQEKALCLH